MLTSSPYAYHRLVVAYHGCDLSTLEGVLLRDEPLAASDNLYDWLGKGVYFWEHGPRRALEFARWKQKRGEIDEPAVLGAYIHLGRCFELTDTWATSQLAEHYEELAVRLAALGQSVPENRPGGPGDFDLVLRYRDCAVLNLAVSRHDTGPATEGGVHFQTVRGVFVEGEPAFDGAGMRTKTHIQIAVRDPGCILGYFKPRLSGL